MDQFQRDIGRHDAEIDALQSDMKELKHDVKKILSTLSEARGGWKTLLLVAGIAGTMGALATKIATFLGFMPR